MSNKGKTRAFAILTVAFFLIALGSPLNFVTIAMTALTIQSILLASYFQTKDRHREWALESGFVHRDVLDSAVAAVAAERGFGDVKDIARPLRRVLYKDTATALRSMGFTVSRWYV